MTGDTDDDYRERLLDEPALRAYLTDRLGAADGLTVEGRAAGHSNETLFVRWGDRALVLRRPPPGDTAETAHDVLREYTVLDALQGTAVPVPPTVLACEDDSVIGAPFFLMDRVPGDVIRAAEPDRFGTPEHRRRVGEELVDTLGRIHSVEYAAVGLGEFGRPAGYTERQVERYREQLAWASAVTADTRATPAMDELGEWLAANLPAEHPHALVHGDYKLDNVQFAPGTPPEIASVFDWELATLGDPRADLGYMLVSWRDPHDPEPAVPELIPGFTERSGYPTREDLVARYEARTGIAFEHERFYRALAVFKLACFGEMFFRRYLKGNADDPLYPRMEERVPALARRGLRIADGDEPL